MYTDVLIEVHPCIVQRIYPPKCITSSSSDRAYYNSMVVTPGPKILGYSSKLPLREYPNIIVILYTSIRT